MKTVNKLEILKMSEISISKTNPRKKIDVGSLKELTQSIRENGVLQPILVRPKGKKFELVCGERRFTSSKLADLKEIPANIRELSNDEAFEMQIIENLERKDVHPLDEADAFKKMLDSGKYTMVDIAAKLAKSEIFIAGRLKLVDLIEPIRVDFKNDFLGIGHAVLIAKCDAEIQEGIFNDAKPWNGEGEANYGTYAELRDNIQDENPDLSDALFDVKDTKLIKGVCACSVCPKRSKYNPVLFDEFQEEDLCFDKKCYNLKSEKSLHNEVAAIINENKDILIVAGYDKPDDFIIDMCKQFNVKILKNNEFDWYSSTNTIKKNGLYVSGSDKGYLKEIYIKQTVADKINTGETSDQAVINDDIQKIETRAVRSLELDAEKVWAAVQNLDKKTFKNNNKPLSDNENMALVVALQTQCFQLFNDVPFIHELRIESINAKTVDKDLLNLIFRNFIYHSLMTNGGSHKTRDTAAAYKQVLEDYYLDDIKSIEANQKEISDKRIDRSTKRIDDLKAKLKVEKPKKTTKKKTSKAK